MRTFISVIPLQNEGRLFPVLYKPVGFDLDSQKKTAFPIIPIIKQEMGKSIDKKDEIIVLKQEKNPDVERNYERFLEELAELGIYEDKVKAIEFSREQTTEKGIRMIMDIVETVSDDSDVYACITFGTKNIPILEMFALIFLEKLKVNCQVQGIYYGEIIWIKERNPEDGWLYDLTPNLYLSRIVDQIEHLGRDDAEKFLRDILGV